MIFRLFFKLLILRNRLSASFGLTVTDEAKFGVWKLSINRHKLLILLMKFMAILPVPLLVRCKPFLPRHSLPRVLLSTISSLREFKWLFKFSTVRDALPSLVLLITLEFITFTVTLKNLFLHDIKESDSLQH